MIAGGSGLSAMLQLLRHKIHEPNSSFSLVISDCSDHDMFYVKELEKLELQFPERLSVVRTLTRDFPPNWDQSVGRINKELVVNHLDLDNTSAIFVCGPDGFVELSINQYYNTTVRKF